MHERPYRDDISDWQEDAKCRDLSPSIFFPIDLDGENEAKRICANCDVRDECLNYAIANREEYGIWGGTNDKERRAIIKQRRLGQSALDI